VVTGTVVLLELLVGVTETGVAEGGWRLRVAFSVRSEGVDSDEELQPMERMVILKRTARYIFINE
jgi:hypothetical protein